MYLNSPTYVKSDLLPLRSSLPRSQELPHPQEIHGLNSWTLTIVHILTDPSRSDRSQGQIWQISDLKDRKQSRTGDCNKVSVPPSSVWVQDPRISGLCSFSTSKSKCGSLHSDKPDAWGLSLALENCQLSPALRALTKPARASSWEVVRGWHSPLRSVL